jgi:hypothetical protein
MDIFDKISIKTGLDFDKAALIDDLIPLPIWALSKKSTEQGTLTKEYLYRFKTYGVLTADLMDSLIACGGDENEIMLASAAKCRQICMQKALDVMTYLNNTLDRHALGLEPLPLPWREIVVMPGTELGARIVQVLNRAQIGLKDFAASCGMRETTIEDIVDDDYRLVKTHEANKLSVGLRQLDPNLTASKLRELFPNRFVTPRLARELPEPPTQS